MKDSSLVIIGNHTQGLGIIRSAVKSGIPIYVVNDLTFSSSRYSRFIKEYFKISKNTIKNLAHEPFSDELTKTLLKIPVEYPSLLMGINEDIINYLSANSETLSGKYFIPKNQYHLIFDKYQFNNLLPEKNKLPTYLLKDFNLKNNSNKDYILKSRVGNKLRNITNEKALVLNGYEPSLQNLISSNFNDEELIVQRIITSQLPVKSSCAFSVEGKIFGLFQYEKVRQHPNQFGTGTYLKSIYDEEIFNIAKTILYKLKYTGISEIEFILDEADLSYKVIEMNPRTWKSINFSTQCGQNLVDKFINYVLQEEVEKDLNYTTDKYWVDIFTDIPQMMRDKKIFSYNFKDMYECSWDKADPYPFFCTILFSPFIFMKI